MSNVLQIETGEKNSILRAKSKLVKKVSPSLLKDMRETLLEMDALGLAAPQVGKNERIFVMRLLLGEMSEKKVDYNNFNILECINPEILDKSKECEIGNEGCLSLPKAYADISRSSIITVRFEDKKGKKQILKLEHLNARIFQHEFDHLEGILFTDYLS